MSRSDQRWLEASGPLSVRAVFAIALLARRIACQSA